MKKAFWGLFFITAAAFVIINQLGYFTDLNIFTLLFTIFLIPIFIKSLANVNFPGMLFSLAFGCILYSNQLGLENITPWPVLIAALLGSIGLSIIFGKHHIYKHCCDEGFEEVVNSEDEEEVIYNIKFGSGIKYINSDNFKKANLKCSFGGMKVYFDNAKIKEDEAVLNLDISFAGVELYIPKEWKIVNKTEVSLGAIEEKNRNSNEGKKTLIIKGKVELSGVEITYI